MLVSVAHASGVDPEASHSTVEMRSQILAQLIPILRLDNVRIEKSHALIHGSKGDYTVHLGSGVCHQSAAGMLDIVAVHSQTRGRMFLPFADDDPKTAEILAFEIKSNRDCMKSGKWQKAGEMPINLSIC